MEEIWAKSGEGKSKSKELLQVHLQQLPRPEARGEGVPRLKGSDHHLRGEAQPRGSCSSGQRLLHDEQASGHRGYEASCCEQRDRIQADSLYC